MRRRPPHLLRRRPLRLALRLSREELAKLWELTGYDRTSHTDEAEIISRVGGAEVVMFGNTYTDYLSSRRISSMSISLAHTGMNPKALQYIMGHADITTTMDYYAHTDSVAAADEMRRTIQGPASAASPPAAELRPLHSFLLSLQNL